MAVQLGQDISTWYPLFGRDHLLKRDVLGTAAVPTIALS